MDQNSNTDATSTREEDERSHNSGTHTQHSSQHSFVSQHSSQQSSHGRSRTASDMSGTVDSHPGGCFFADMTLDLSEAQMETTPRTDSKFASMATSGKGSVKEELMRQVPVMPLIEEPVDPGAGMMEGMVDIDSEFDPEDFTTPAKGAINEEESNAQRPFARIESGSAPILHNQSTHSSSMNSSYPRPTRPPRRPRDVSWTAAALIVMPLGLFLPHMYYPNGYIDRHNSHPCAGGANSDCHPHHPSWSQMALSHSTHSTILISSLLATTISLALLRMLYSCPGGGEGDDRRHANVTRTLLLASNLCIWLNPLLALTMWHWLPNVRVAMILPLSLMARDAWRVKKSGSALPSFRNRSAVRRRDSNIGGMSYNQQGTIGVVGFGNGPTGGGVGGSSASSSDRKTFFRALAVASLDILSRSLRRNSFVRAASALLLLQFLCISLWWGALSVILSVEIFDEDGIVTKFMHLMWLLVTIVAGKWATGTIARLLGFVASGGVASWFARQTVVIELMERREADQRHLEEQQQQRQQQSSSSTKAAESSSEQKGGETTTEDGSSHGADASHGSSMISDDPASGYTSNYASARAALHAMPEAYRTADASAYASVLDFDEGLDDDYEEEEDLDGPQFLRRGSREGGGSIEQTISSSTVKAFLTAGCTFSFGSVAQCGLLGGLAQFLWSVVRNVDAMGFFLQNRFSSNDSMGFRGMDISVNGAASPAGWKQKLAYWYRKMDVAIRGFVQSHSDLAMSHVAAYFKSYQRAANDVAVLIETSGVESIIHDDITTHMCSSVGHLVAGSIVIIFGIIFATHRNTFASDPLADATLFEVLLFSYILCYTMLFTVMEPLRAAIKAVYVCFAEHPLSLSQAFPLIYQRLSRISEASSSGNL